MNKTSDNSACSGTICNDSAGDTSQRCDKAPAHCVSSMGIKSPEQFLQVSNANFEELFKTFSPDTVRRVI